YNSILAHSSGGNCSGPVTDGGYNISDEDTCGFAGTNVTTGQTIGDNVNPLLASNGLQNNGGPTQTIALEPNSPAIAAIPIAHQCPATDQRGDPRPNPEGPATACDIGAFEYQGVVPTPTPIIVNTTADPGSAGVCALRDAITAANTQVAVNGCAAGTGTDTIAFSVSGTITLSSA